MDRVLFMTLTPVTENKVEIEAAEGLSMKALERLGNLDARPEDGGGEFSP